MKTKQQKVSVPVINRYIERALRGETPPNIKITDTHVIIEGNHRYIAGYVTKRLPGTDPYPDSKPNAPSYDFGDLVYDDADWGGE